MGKKVKGGIPAEFGNVAPSGGQSQYPVVQWKPGLTVYGTLVKALEDVGENESMMYHIEQDNGETVAVWGGAQIDAAFEQLPMGSRVCLTFKGMKKIKRKDGGRGTVKDYEIRVIPASGKKKKK